jgi:signal transduction histidine kinase
VFEKYRGGAGGQRRLNYGLGLYFCRKAVETHGGTIRVESTAALPTLFVIDLPGA